MFYTLVLGGKSGVQQNKFINRVLVWAMYAQEFDYYYYYYIFLWTQLTETISCWILQFDEQIEAH